MQSVHINVTDFLLSFFLHCRIYLLYTYLLSIRPLLESSLNPFCLRINLTFQGWSCFTIQNEHFGVDLMKVYKITICQDTKYNKYLYPLADRLIIMGQKSIRRVLRWWLDFWTVCPLEYWKQEHSLHLKILRYKPAILRRSRAGKRD